MTLSTKTMRQRVLCAMPLPPAVALRAEQEFAARLSQDRQLSAADIIELMSADPQLQALLISSRVKFNAADVAALPGHVRLISTCSVGYEHVDLPTATMRGIMVTNTPDVVTESTADMAILLMLGACRNVKRYMDIMAEGWGRHFGFGEELGIEFSGKTLGIVGMGRIGQAVAKRVRSFGLRVLYHSRNPLPEGVDVEATYFSDLRAMLPHCQILSLHVPGGPGMDGLINASTLALLPEQAVLVNTARGSLVDEDDLVAALQSGRLAAAGMDVFRKEPNLNMSLQRLSNVFLMPHMGTGTVETRDAMGHRALDNIAALFAGHGPADLVTQER